MSKDWQQKIEERLVLLECQKSYPNNDCYTAEDVAKMLNVSIATIKKYERQGLIIAYYPMAQKRYKRKDVDRFLRGMKPRKKKNDGVVGKL